LAPILEESIHKELPKAHPTLKKLKKTPSREDLKEVSINLKPKCQANPPKFLDFKGKSHKKENGIKQKSMDSFLSTSKAPETLVRSILFQEKTPENGLLVQSQPTNIASTNNFFNNNEKIKMSSLQKALFYNRLEGLYAKTIETIHDFKSFTISLRESLLQEVKASPDPEFISKMIKFCLLRFIFENPNESWHKVYKPLCCKDILNVKNTKYIKGWLEGFFKKAREKGESKGRNNGEYSSDFNSELFDETSKESHSRRYGGNKANLQEIQEISRENKWKFNTLLIRGKQGIGKSTAVFSAAIDMEYEIIEINNSSKRSETALKKIYEATQSQGMVSSHFKDFMLKVL